MEMLSFYVRQGNVTLPNGQVVNLIAQSYPSPILGHIFSGMPQYANTKNTLWVTAYAGQDLLARVGITVDQAKQKARLHDDHILEDKTGLYKELCAFRICVAMDLMVKHLSVMTEEWNREQFVDDGFAPDDVLTKFHHNYMKKTFP